MRPSLFLIAKDLTRMQIWVAVNEADVGRIVPGGPVTFTCDAFPGREFNATVGKVRLNATMTQNVVMYTVEVNTENPGNVLLPYLTANVHFIVGQESNALLAPNAALRWSPSSPAQVLPSARSAKAAGPGAGRAPGRRTAGPGPSGPASSGSRTAPTSVRSASSSASPTARNTAITADAAREGQEVVTGEMTAESAQSDARSPFMPQVIRR